ncbi:MAG: M23 family metallopeptidase [Erysipelotrichaceae bacterium]|nr:M23 family metallopeptidase [Erysipelotrichaceae bacterium]
MKKILVLLSVLLLCSCSSKNLSFINPINNGKVVSEFDENKGVYSISIRPESLIEDTKVISSEEGKVISIDTRADKNNVIIIEHTNGYKTMYSGVTDVTVSINKTVEKGEQLGYLNNLSRLDFVIIKDNERLKNSSEYIT